MGRSPLPTAQAPSSKSLQPFLRLLPPASLKQPQDPLGLPRCGVAARFDANHCAPLPEPPPVFLPEQRRAASSESPSCLPARDSPPRGAGRGDQPGSSLFSLPISLVTRSLAAGRKRFYNCRDAGFELFARWLFLALNHKRRGEGEVDWQGVG